MLCWCNHFSQTDQLQLMISFISQNAFPQLLQNEQITHFNSKIVVVHKIHGSVCFWYNRETKHMQKLTFWGFILKNINFKWQLFGHNSYCKMYHTETLVYGNTCNIIVIPNGYHPKIPLYISKYKASFENGH